MTCLCLNIQGKSGRVSRHELQDMFLDRDENVEPTDDRCLRDVELEATVDSVFSEVELRGKHCGRNSVYPFEASENMVILADTGRRNGGSAGVVYRYFLLATRYNMKSNRKYAGIDATLLFEELCKEVAERFWGGPGESVDARVLGTARLRTAAKRVGFRAAVEQSLRDLGGGLVFQMHDPHEDIDAKDDGVDILLWRRFADNRPGVLIGCGQCKTGTSWSSSDLRALNPKSFFSKWACKQPHVDPIPLFFLAQRVVTKWNQHCVDAGLLFDRCRIVEYASNLSEKLTARIEAWVQAAENDLPRLIEC